MAGLTQGLDSKAQHHPSTNNQMNEQACPHRRRPHFEHVVFLWLIIVPGLSLLPAAPQLLLLSIATGFYNFLHLHGVQDTKQESQLG